MTAPALDAALQLAAEGLPVFPCGRKKTPSISQDAGGRGFLDATTDPVEIQRLFNRSNAHLVGVPTGVASGFDVLDIDPRHNGDIWERANLYRLPETRVHETKSGGRHWFFYHAPGVRNFASKKTFAEGIDVRGEGGYVIFPPSTGYKVILDAPIAHWPDWLLQPGLVLPALPPARPSTSQLSMTSAKVSEEWMQEFIDRALNKLRNAPDGAKHFTLRNTALLLGGIAEQFGLTDSDLLDRMSNAIPDGVKDWRSARATALWGLENGRNNPIALRQLKPKARDARRKETAASAFRLLKAGLAGADILTELDKQNSTRPAPLPPDIIRATVLWAAQRLKDGAHA